MNVISRLVKAMCASNRAQLSFTDKSPFTSYTTLTVTPEVHNQLTFTLLHIPNSRELLREKNKT